MAEEGSKKIVFGFDVNGPDFQNTIDKIRALEQAARGLADTLARANLAGAGGESPITGGVATPRPMGAAGGDLGIAGAGSDRYSGPLLNRASVINRNLKDFIPILKEYATEYTRLLTALSAPLPAGTSAADLLTAIAAGGGPRGGAGGRASSEGTVAPPSDTGGGGGGRRGGGRRRRDEDEDGDDDTSPRPKSSKESLTRLIDRAQGYARGFDSFARGVQGITSSAIGYENAMMKMAMIPLNAQVGKEALYSYGRAASLSGDLTFVSMLNRTYENQMQLGKGVPGDKLGTFAQIYGFKDVAQKSLELQQTGAQIGKYSGALAMGMQFGIMGIQMGNASAAGATGSASAAGAIGSAGGSMGSFAGVMNSEMQIIEAEAMLKAGMPLSLEQQNMIKAFEIKKNLPYYQNIQLYHQQKQQMLDMHRSLGRIGTSAIGGFGGEQAYQVSQAIGIQYGIAPQDMAGFAGMAAHRRSTYSKEQYLQTLDTYARMHTAGYSQNATGTVSDIANLLQVNRMGSGMGQYYAGQEADILAKFSGPIGVQEAGIDAVQQLMTGFGGIASQAGFEKYAGMLTAGAANAQSVKMRSAGVNALTQMSQIPLFQAMTAAKFRTTALGRGSDVSTQLAVQQLNPLELMDIDKLGRIVDPFEKIKGDRTGKLTQLSKELVDNLFNTLAPNVVGKDKPLGKEISRLGGMRNVIDKYAFDESVTGKGYVSELSKAFSIVTGSMTSAQGAIELIAAGGKPVTPSALRDAGNQNIRQDVTRTLAAQTEAIYAGMNSALGDMQGVFTNAAAEIQNVMNQLANNTTGNITGLGVTSTLGR